MAEKAYPKYQASFFFAGDKQDQLVVRSDDKKEFDEMLAWVKKIKEVKNGNDEQPKPSKTTPQVEAIVCPQCGSDMWDNRPKKASGEFKANSPDFKCKDNKCSHVIWPERKK